MANAPKTDVTGRFTSSFSQVGRPFQASAVVRNNIGEAAGNLLDSVLRAGAVIREQNEKETPADRLKKNELERQANEKVALTAAAYRYKPDEFLQASQKDKTEFMKNVEDRYYDWANVMFEQKMTNYHGTVEANKITLDRTKEFVSFQEKSQEYYDGAMNAAQHGDMAGFAALSAKWSENENFMLENGFLTGEQKARRAKEYADDGVITNLTFGAKKHFGDMGSLNSFLDNIEKSNTYSVNQKKSAKNAILSEYSNWQTRNKIAAANSIKEADFAIAAYGAGIEPKDFDIDKTFRDLSNAGLNDKAAQLQEAYDFRKETKNFAKLEPAQMNAVIEDLKKNAGSAEDLKKIKVYASLAQTAQKELQTDPLAYGIQYGVVDDDGVDITKPETLKKRMNNAVFLQQKYNLSEAPVLTKGEASALGTAISKADSDQKAVILGAIAQGFGDSANLVYEKVAADNPEFAVAGKIFNNNPTVAASIIQGKAIKDNESGFAPQDNLNLHNALGKLDSVLINFDTEDVAAVKAAVVARATYLNKKNNIYKNANAATDSTVSRKTMEQAVQDVLGVEITTMRPLDNWFSGSYTTALPEGTSKDEFVNWVSHLTDQEIGKVYSSSGEHLLSPEKIRKEGKFIYNDNNTYTVLIGDNMVLNADGTPLVLTYGGKK